MHLGCGARHRKWLSYRTELSARHFREHTKAKFRKPGEKKEDVPHERTVTSRRDRAPNTPSMIRLIFIDSIEQ